MKTGLAFVAAVACAGAASQGAIIGTTGNILQIGAPASVVPGALPTLLNAVAFDERQLGTAAGPADISMNPWIAMPLSPGGFGGFVNSHFIHADTTGLPVGLLVNGSVTFDGNIVAVEVTSPGNIPPNNLDVTDFLGALGTVYPTGFPTRGWNAAGQIQVIGATIRFNQVAVQGLDQFRVITQAPAPASLALLSLAGVVAGRRRR